MATAKKPKVPRPRTIKKLKVTHVSLMPNGTFELGVQQARTPKPAPKAKPAKKPTRKEQ